ncbi:hypothetical protein ES705_32574 [subsurface metagenome]
MVSIQYDINLTTTSRGNEIENNQQIHKNNRKNTEVRDELEKSQFKETQNIGLGSKTQTGSSFRQ